MILSGSEIFKRLCGDEIFKTGTWDRKMLKEASYALRIAKDGLLLDGNWYDPGIFFDGNYIEIKPGTIAILSTVERLNMPGDLVGKIGIRLDYAAKGLTGLMGIQVDPFYGRHLEDERLFIRVTNLGNETVKLRTGDPVFTFELHKIKGTVDPPSPPKSPTWERLRDRLIGQREVSWTYAARIEAELSTEVKNIQDNLHPVILFGVFLVAVTILGVTINLILSLRDTPAAEVPRWVTGWGWILLFGTLSAATLATAFVGFAAGVRVLCPPRR